MLKEFREFVMRGNVLDLAIGVIIGGAFGKIVSSLVNDVIMPLIGLILGGRANFTEFFITLNGQTYPTLQAAKDGGAPVLAYGAFITAVIDFLIIAFVIFLVVKAANRMRRQPPAPAAPTTKDCAYCFTTIPIQATRCPHCTSELIAK